MKRVVITGIGPISSLGIGCEEIWDSVVKAKTNLVKQRYEINRDVWGEFYLHKMRNFNIKNFHIDKKNFDFINELRTVRYEDTDLYYFMAVIKLALEDSGLIYDEMHNEIGLIITHENPGIEVFFEELIDTVFEILVKYDNKIVSKLELAKKLYERGCEDRGYNLQTFSYLFSAAKAFNLHGYSLFINNACASGLFAIDSAARQIREGVSPAVVVAAVDNPTKIYKYLWFRKHGLYAEDGITKPFSSEKSGIVFGDGGAALILEELEHARRRGAKIYGEYLGGGFSLEGWKITVPNITDDFYARSFEKALKVSGVHSSEIDFINPHGVGTQITDSYEAIMINKIFEKYMPLVSAFKPLVGHNLGGSALIELAIAMLSMKNNLVPATLNSNNINEKLRLNIVRDNTEKKLNIVAKMSCGFAGFNGVSIFKKVQ